MTYEILIAGFGGQGVMAMGKSIAEACVKQQLNVSWLPSYGPEMRGGTANCSVILSDEDVGSPIVSAPDCLMAMNLPSLDKFEKSVRPGGQIFVDSSLVDRKVERSDVQAYYVPATTLAREMGYPTLANMILLGKMMKECDAIGFDHAKEALEKVVSAKHRDMLQANLAALQCGYEA